MTLVYLDTSILIYLIEGEAGIQRAVKDCIAELGARPATSFITSRLTRLECRVKPLREQNAALMRQYDHLLGASTLRLCELTPEVIERATELRAHHRFTTPDAIHLATAIELGASSFLTGDDDLTRCPDLPVQLVPAPSG